MPATLQKAIAQPHVSGGRVVTYPEAASQTFPAYFPVKFSSGKVAAWQTVGTTVTSITSGDAADMIGIALRAASGTTDTDIPILLIDEGTELELPLRHGTTVTSSDYANVEVGLTYTAGLVSDILCVNNETTTNGMFTVIEKKEGVSTTEDYTRVVVKVVDAIRAVG